jgi:hypothetical protein
MNLMIYTSGNFDGSDFSVGCVLNIIEEEMRD